MTGLPTGFITGLQAHTLAKAEGYYEGFASYCESPIETLFLTAFYFVVEDYGGFQFGEPGETQIGFMFVKPQEPVGSYRADFVIGVSDFPKAPRIVVECDGHDFHERTKEQAARDRRRDREMQSLGFKVFRFTGSEIYRDAMRCAGEVAREASRIHMRCIP